MRISFSAFFIYLIFIPVGNNYGQSLFEKSIHAENLDVLHYGNFSSYSFADSAGKNSKAVFKMKKSPLKAVIYSAILPGAGQFYNHSFWKIPIIGALGGYFGYELIKNNNKFLDYKSQYISSQTILNPTGDPQLLAFREFYRDQRDNFIIYSVILYVVNLIDAYVDAQLYDFNVSDKIKLSVLTKKDLLKLSFNF